MTTEKIEGRRPLASRQTGWARFLAARLAKTAITPNQISLLSVCFAALGGLLIAFVQGPLAWIPGAVCVQMRLLCNLMDGMVAVEGSKGSPSGALYNEVPDRLADALFLIAAGHAAGHDWLGWLCALLAVMTAYLRAFGAQLGFGQDFSGVMSKPRRMAALTLGLVCASLEYAYLHTGFSLTLALLAIALGSLHTCYLRTRNILVRLDGA
jgi:phosphatidylglycerophosphate synthase